MRRLIALLAMAMLMAPGPGGAAARGRSKGHEVKVVKMGDGLYTIADRSIACRVHGEQFACSNPWITVVCHGEVCAPREYPEYPRDLWVDAKDAKRPEARVLPPGASVEFADALCTARRNSIDCVVEYPKGGFQLSGLFERVLLLDHTPSRNWPWDGKRYSRKDLPCMKPSCQKASSHIAR